MFGNTFYLFLGIRENRLFLYFIFGVTVSTFGVQNFQTSLFSRGQEVFVLLFVLTLARMYLESGGGMRTK